MLPCDYFKSLSIECTTSEPAFNPHDRWWSSFWPCLSSPTPIASPEAHVDAKAAKTGEAGLWRKRMRRRRKAKAMAVMRW